MELAAETTASESTNTAAFVAGFPLWACGLGKGQIVKVSHRGMSDGYTQSEQNYENRQDRKECGAEETWYIEQMENLEADTGQNMNNVSLHLVLPSLKHIKKHCNSANFPSLSTIAMDSINVT